MFVLKLNFLGIFILNYSVNFNHYHDDFIIFLDRRLDYCLNWFTNNKNLKDIKYSSEDIESIYES